MNEQEKFRPPHEWVRDEEGYVKDHELGGHHSGPECLNCGKIICANCYPEFLTEPCPEGDAPLIKIAEVLNAKQLDFRWRQLKKQGYILRDHEVVGWREPPKPCPPGQCKWKTKTKKIIGEGVYRRMHKTMECVVCHQTAIW